MDGFGHCLLLLQAELETPRANGWLILGVLAVVFITPFLLGNLIGRLLRLEDLSGRIGVVLMSLFMALAPFVYQEIAGRLDEGRVRDQHAAAKAKAKEAKSKATESDVKISDGEFPEGYKRKTWRDAVHWGIDLAGGTNLVYEIDLAAAKEQGKTVDKATVEKMVSAIIKRINPSGAEEVAVRRVGTDRIEIIIPGADTDLVRQKKELIVKLGSLEFGIVANERNDQGLIDQAMKLPNNQNELLSTTSDDKRLIVAAWHDLSDIKDLADPKDTEGRWRGDGHRIVTRLHPKTGVETDVAQVLIKHDPPNRAVTGAYLTNVRAETDERGSLAVSFTLNSKGGALFTKLTGDNLPDPIDGSKRQLAILLDGKVHSAPTINSAIGANGQITGRFTKPEIDNLVAVLNAGALAVPLKLNPVSEVIIRPLHETDVKK